MFNPRPRIERVAIDGPVGEMACWVVDDLLLEPQALVEAAVQARARFTMAPFNAYPGLELRLGDEVDAALSDFFMLQLRGALGARRTLSMYSRLSLATLQPGQLRPLQRLCHRDRFGVEVDQMAVACTLYLFQEAALGGTSFFRPRQPLHETNALIRHANEMGDEAFTQAIGSPSGYLTASNAWFEFLYAVPPAFNRAVFYDGNLFHSSHILAPERLSDDPARGRLTLNGFFICRRQAA
jgi:hypothetical protein